MLVASRPRWLENIHQRSNSVFYSCKPSLEGHSATYFQTVSGPPHKTLDSSFECALPVQGGG